MRLTRFDAFVRRFSMRNMRCVMLHALIEDEEKLRIWLSRSNVPLEVGT
jgi:hypothetical protein